MKNLRLLSFITTLFLMSSMGNTYAQLQSGYHYKIKNAYRLIPIGEEKLGKTRELVIKYQTNDTIKTSTNIDLLEAEYRIPKLLEGNELISIDKIKELDLEPYLLVKYNKIAKTDKSAIIKEINKEYSRWLFPRNLKANLKPSEEKGKENILIVDFWGFKGYNPQNKNDYQKDTNSVYITPSLPIDKSSILYLEINKREKLGDIENYISIPYATWQFGVTTIPIKFRRGGTAIAKEEPLIDAPEDWQPAEQERTISNSTTAAINAGLFFGRKWGRTRFYDGKSRNHNSIGFEIAGFFGPTVVELNDTNSTQFVVQKSSELALSYGLGAMISYRDINLGGYFGKDSIVGSSSKYWYFNNKTWFGIGLGFGIKIFGGKS